MEHHKKYLLVLCQTNRQFTYMHVYIETFSHPDKLNAWLSTYIHTNIHMHTTYMYGYIQIDECLLIHVYTCIVTHMNTHL